MKTRWVDGWSLGVYNQGWLGYTSDAMRSVMLLRIDSSHQSSCVVCLAG